MGGLGSGLGLEGLGSGAAFDQNHTLRLRACLLASPPASAAVIRRTAASSSRHRDYCTLACNLRLGGIRVLGLGLKGRNLASDARHVGQGLPAGSASARHLLQLTRNTQLSPLSGSWSVA